MITVFIFATVYCILNSSVTAENVSKCYFCNGECKNPLEEITCRNASDVRFGCITSKGSIGFRTDVEFKSCIDLDNILDKQNCAALNAKADSFCSICDTNLCNSEMVFKSYILGIVAGLIFHLIL